MNKALGILLAILLFAAGSAQAHCGKCGVGDAPKMDASSMPGEKADNMAKKLKLSDEQKAQLKTILEEKMTKKQQLMEEKHKAMDALHEEFKTKLGGILTPEQMKQWEETKEDRAEMKDKCPMCKDGKKCDMCKMKKGKNKKSHDDKDGHNHK